MKLGASRPARRYASVTTQKAGGATYTPTSLSDFVAGQMVTAAELPDGERALRMLDPAVGEGELLASLLGQLPGDRKVEIHGFDTDERALTRTESRLREAFPEASVHLHLGDFLSFVLDKCGGAITGGLFEGAAPERYDLIIANPPYVRTQIMGADQARKLAAQFGLAGRVDLCYAFILGIAKVLSPDGIAGIIVSNRLMTTKAGASVRRALRSRFRLRHVWDLGDTKLFDAAVLPAVLLVGGGAGRGEGELVGFTSIYETRNAPEHTGRTPIDALRYAGVVELVDGRRFRVQHGQLDQSGRVEGVWRLATEKGDAWLSTVAAHTWRKFSEVGRIRVGVKTCADRVFIRNDWETIHEDERPELLRALATHHVSRRFRAAAIARPWRILYPHESSDGKRRAVDLEQYPRSKAYLERHRRTLEGRRYVLEGGRNWYEIWVPQDPGAWQKPKLVFRDISEKPCFWIDLEGSVVNGDCYWMIAERQEEEELLWLAAAVANSTFIEAFYDHRFNNRLYARRRRFITQYVQEFPLPDATSSAARAIITEAKRIYAAAGTADAEWTRSPLDRMIWEAFGLGFEEVAR